MHWTSQNMPKPSFGCIACRQRRVKVRSLRFVVQQLKLINISAMSEAEAA
jgi:hypothetical protein